MPFSFRWAIFEGRETFPPGAAAAILILFGLAALAAAVSSLNKLSDGISTHWPAWTPRLATIPAGLLALCLMATGLVDRLGPIFIAMGSFFAPALGAMAGDLTGKLKHGLAFRTGSTRRRSRLGRRLRSCLRTMSVPRRANGDHSSWLEQGSICGFIVAACVYRLLAAMAVRVSRRFREHERDRPVGKLRAIRRAGERMPRPAHPADSTLGIHAAWQFGHGATTGSGLLIPMSARWSQMSSNRRATMRAQRSDPSGEKWRSPSKCRL